MIRRLNDVIPDKDVMNLLEKIVHSWNKETGVGLPMGNMTRQLFGLFYLDPIDRLIKEKLQIKHYTRYMDDMAILHKNNVRFAHSFGHFVPYAVRFHIAAETA